MSDGNITDGQIRTYKAAYNRYFDDVLKWLIPCAGDISFEATRAGLAALSAIDLEATKAEIAAKDAELSLLSAQREWLKDRLADLQLPANSPKNIEEWLVECGMPTGGIDGRS